LFFINKYSETMLESIESPRNSNLSLFFPLLKDLCVKASNIGPFAFVEKPRCFSIVVVFFCLKLKALSMCSSSFILKTF
tara:strand:+ start:244 stop:480 length:237 start_codon:yes stop_codon:yes gene_type:complete